MKGTSVLGPLSEIEVVLRLIFASQMWSVLGANLGSNASQFLVLVFHARLQSIEPGRIKLLTLKGSYCSKQTKLRLQYYRYYYAYYIVELT